MWLQENLPEQLPYVGVQILDYIWHHNDYLIDCSYTQLALIDCFFTVFI